MIITNRRKRDKQIDMLNGSLFDKILKFAIPIAGASILQQLFTSVDIAVLGKFATSKAQAAVGCNGAVINVILNLFIGISVGVNVVIARYIGENKKEKIKETVHTAILIAAIIGTFLFIVGIFISRHILMWVNTPENIIEYAILYLRIYFIGVPFMMIYNFGSAILRSTGNTKGPLYCLALAGVANVGLNLILVIYFHLGVAGVAIGTVVSNMICSCMVMYLLMHEEGYIRVSLRKLKISICQLKEILKIGLPAGLQTVVFSLANVFIQACLNGYGSNAVAGSSITINYECYAYFFIASIVQATVTFTSQNFGAKQYDRCKKIFVQTIAISILVSAIMSICFIFGRDFFISLFTSEPKVAKYASIRMIHLFSFYILISFYEVTGGALRGIGYSMTPAILTIFGTCILRLLWIATVCKKYTSFETLISVYPVSWAITGILVTSSYFIIRKKVFEKGVKDMG